MPYFLLEIGVEEVRSEHLVPALVAEPRGTRGKVAG